ncbi:MAG: PadR family transcriptional regulator [Candidatus Limnocylindrales bacterium]
MAGYSLNATAASLLGFLMDGPLTGWDLVRTAEERIGDFWSLTRSQVYRELTAMAAAGLIRAGELGPRDRRPYAITSAGQKAFRAWLEREPGPEPIRFPLLVTLLLGRHLPPGRLAEMVAHHRALHADRLAGYEAAHAELVGSRGRIDPISLAPLELGIAYERAVMAWFDQLPLEIAGTAAGKISGR